jgi:hypothetical protein
MISLPSSVRVFLHAPPTDLRKGFDALCGLVTTAFGQDPTSGHLLMLPSLACSIGAHFRALAWLYG